MGGFKTFKEMYGGNLEFPEGRGGKLWSFSGTVQKCQCPPRQGVLTIYIENLEIPDGKLNGMHHSIWSISEIVHFWST